MPVDPPNTPDSFEEAERFQRMFVTPVADAVRTEVRNLITPITERLADVENDNRSNKDRIAELEASRSKALIGYGVFATGLSLALTASIDYIKRLLGW